MEESAAGPCSPAPVAFHTSTAICHVLAPNVKIRVRLVRRANTKQSGFLYLYRCIIRYRRKDEPNCCVIMNESCSHKTIEVSIHRTFIVFARLSTTVRSVSLRSSHIIATHRAATSNLKRIQRRLNKEYHPLRIPLCNKLLMQQQGGACDTRAYVSPLARASSWPQVRCDS